MPAVVARCRLLVATIRIAMLVPVMPYTTNDTPAIVQRIDRDLAFVVETVREGDSRLRSLVLTGGFARGEGTVLDGVPQNDYDLVAIRAVGRPRTSYADMRAQLERHLGLHIDLAPVPAWRLRWTQPSIFWYETALRGRVLWGAPMLRRIKARAGSDLNPAEGLRLLVNRAAGLLLVSESNDDNAVRIQAAKAILASLDAHMLAAGHFAPSQTERWLLFQQLLASGQAPAELVAQGTSLEWAYRFKVDPASIATRHPDEAWRSARCAILNALPAALRHARLDSISAYGRTDRMADHIVYGLRAHDLEGARRFVVNPTGRVRVATLALLAAAANGRVMRNDALRCLSSLAHVGPDPLRTLEGLRSATLQ